MEFPKYLQDSFLDKHTMTPLRRLVKNVLIKLTGNRFAQDLLEEIVQTAHVLQGVGGGSIGSSEVQTSGEKALFNILKQSADPPYCIFDVGANRGQFLRLLLDNISTEHYSIHCFEPGNEAFRMLHDSFAYDERFRLNNIAIGKEPGESLLFYDVSGSGCASLTRRRLDHLGIQFDMVESVQLNTIDGYCSENDISHIHLLKIDIEGHELDALNGARMMFENGAVGIVSFEFGGCNVDTRTFFQDFWYFFSSHNLKLFRITPGGYFYPVEAYSEIHEKFGVSNFMAVLTDDIDRTSLVSGV